jgi:TolB protein
MHRMTIPLALTTVMVFVACARLAARSTIADAVVFASERDGNTDIWFQRLDGSGLRRLTTNAAPDQQPRCSPDGRSVLFVRGEGRARAIVHLDMTNGVERQLTSSGAYDYTPSWSRDGSRIYFTRGGREGEFDRLAEMNVDGTGVRFLTDGTAHDVRPLPSPDGRKLLYHSYRYERGNTELHLLDLSTGATQRITDSPARDYEGTFADSTRVLFSSNRDGGHFRLYELHLPTGAVRRVLDTGHDIWGARYSGDGRVLVYTGTTAQWRVLKLSLRTGQATALLDPRHSNAAADWCTTARSGQN